MSSDFGAQPDTLPVFGPGTPPPANAYTHAAASLAGQWASAQFLASNDAARASGALNWIPTYGNYGGNGLNDAWEMASNYFGRTIDHTSGNIQYVYKAMYTTGRIPIDEYDWAHLDHDLGSINTDGLHQVLNDIGAAIKVASHLIEGDPATGGYGYVIASIPFVELGASAYQEGVAIFQAGKGIVQSVADGISAVWGGAGSAMGSLFEGNLGGALNDFVSSLGSAAGGFLTALKDGLEHIFPVVLDFQDVGPNLISLADSHAELQMSAGVSDHVAWVGSQSGILAFDANHNGIVDGAAEISLSLLKPNAITDLDGLSALDDNKDGLISSSDADYQHLIVWFDHNGDGIYQAGEGKSLAEAGVQSIDLTLNFNGSYSGESWIADTGKFTMVGGREHHVFDVELGKEFTDHSIVG